MAAAIAASRSVVMSGNRPLDERERKRFSYFASLSPMARKIMQDKERIREKYGPEWARLPPAQQDAIIDRCLVGPSAPAPRAPGDPEEPARFPGLRGPTGQKLVRFGDEVGAAGPGPGPGPGPSPLPAPRLPVRGARGRGAPARSGGASGGPGAEGRRGGSPGVWGAPESRRRSLRTPRVALSAGPPRVQGLLGCFSKWTQRGCQAGRAGSDPPQPPSSRPRGAPLT